MSATVTEPTLIAEPEPLNELVAKLSTAPIVAIDTEFIRERTYFPELCVLQIATDDGVAAIDCLADLDLMPLIDALLADRRPWVLHSARQDLEVLEQRFGRLPATLIDTQIAAALLGHPLQIGLQKMLVEILGTAIGKEHTRADWRRRPLAASVVRYALDDVRYLLAAWRELNERLVARNRLAWLEEDCRQLLDAPTLPDNATLLERTKGSGSLKGRQRAAALALIAWREQRAMERNKPRRWILADDVLVAIAAAIPESVDELMRIRGLPHGLGRRSGDAIIASIASADCVVENPDRPPPDKSAVKFLQAQVKAIADEHGVQPELLATRKDIAMAASGDLPAAFTSGWRSVVLAPVAATLRQAPAS